MTSSPVTNTTEAEFASGYACRALEEGNRKVGLLLSVGAFDLAVRQTVAMSRLVKYLKVNFTAAALARGPVQL